MKVGKHIDLRCDFGFKYCMSDPIVMKSFLNAILEGDVETITEVQFENVEVPKVRKKQRGVTFDLRCTTQSGDSILIEMQNSCQKFFKTRANFYVHKLIDSKIKKGLAWEDMKEDISRIIGIFILGESVHEIDEAVTCTAECNVKTGKIFWDRHRKYFLSLPKFKLDANNITMKDIWLYTFKNLGKMENIDPSVYERADEGLLKMIEMAKVGALSEKDYAIYEASLKLLADEVDMEKHGYKRGLEVGEKRGIEIGEKRGEKRGIEIGEKRGMISTIKMLVDGGMPISEISKHLHISEEEINAMI
ncbi:MAG: Rpn family recombination-promoting nuclease/putative transposase [Paludibacteraceae bacterium]|nr:Rpn family recombination-promoting nuclease/putative transposase [Paludibacteraceae bacterium]